MLGAALQSQRDCHSHAGGNPYIKDERKIMLADIDEFFGFVGFIIQLAVSIFILVMLYRSVRAQERIADKLEDRLKIEKE